MNPRQTPEPPQTSTSGLFVLPNSPPLVWPDPRCATGSARHEPQPPFAPFAAASDLIAGVLVGVSDETVKWIDSLFRNATPREMKFVVVAFPTGPTREEHLIALKMIQGQALSSEGRVAIRVLPGARVFGPDFEKPVLPPTTILAHCTKTGQSLLSIGSVGDAGHDDLQPTSFNLFFHPDDALRDSWRRWFQLIFSTAAPLSTDTVKIPYLIPVQGDSTAAKMWHEFENACRGLPINIKVDSKTGEIIEADGSKVEPWDGGKTALDPLGQMLQKVYAAGSLVTVDETTRIKPLAIPVKATLLGQQSERTVGAVTHKQSFSLQVLDEAVAKQVEKCRKVTDLIDLLSYLLSHGNHWLATTAKELLEKRLEARNKDGLSALKNALGGDDVAQFVQKRRHVIRENLNSMYKQLGQGKAVPDDKFTAVLAQVEARLTAALKDRLTPRAIYNRIAPPDLTANARDENWAQPLSLLLRSARLMRESLTDPYFPRRLSGLSFDGSQFQTAMNIFGDVILKDGDPRRARLELEELAKIEAADCKLKEKCASVWKIICGEASDPPQSVRDSKQTTATSE